MNLDLEKTLQFINGLYGLPKGTLVFLWCLIFGRIIKGMPWVHNSAIPLLAVFNGGIWMLLLSDFKSSAIESVNVFIGTNLIVGFITGGLSVVVHRWVWKPLLKRFGVSDGFDSDPALATRTGTTGLPTTEAPGKGPPEP